MYFAITITWQMKDIEHIILKTFVQNELNFKWNYREENVI